jgi:uncharacterized membrane protein
MEARKGQRVCRVKIGFRSLEHLLFWECRLTVMHGMGRLSHRVMDDWSASNVASKSSGFLLVCISLVYESSHLWSMLKFSLLDDVYKANIPS